MGELIAAIYDPLIAPLDPMGLRRWRQWVVGAAHGRVLELGVGTGLNLPYYSAGATIAAIEPDGPSLRRAIAKRNGQVLALHQARAEELPFADGSFDAVVDTLVFCSIGDPERALAEVCRVLRPGGAFRLVEHVRVINPVVAGIQDWLTPLWKEMAGNCHLNRDTATAVERAGFRIHALYPHIGGLVVGIDAIKPGN